MSLYLTAALIEASCLTAVLIIASILTHCAEGMAQPDYCKSASLCQFVLILHSLNVLTTRPPTVVGFLCFTSALSPL